MVSNDIIGAVWQLTRYGNQSFDLRYLDTLKRVLKTPKLLRYRDSFEVKKNSGGTRKIVPAKPDLAMVQGVLAHWLTHTFVRSKDYCYTGKGVLAAVQKHLGSQTAFLVDLKSAFDHVTSARLKFALKSRLTAYDDNVLDVLCDLMTYPVYGGVETTPQGCVSTPYAFNLVVSAMDKQLALLAKTLGNLKLTRYSDNICMSSEGSLDLISLQKFVRSVIEANGFEISWLRAYTQPPFAYLGTLVYQNKIQLDPEKYGKFCDTLSEALQSKTPNVYRAQITGIYTWAHNICGEDLPQDLLDLLLRYFEKVQRPPKSLTALIVDRSNPKLF